MMPSSKVLYGIQVPWDFYKASRRTIRFMIGLSLIALPALLLLFLVVLLSVVILSQWLGLGRSMTTSLGVVLTVGPLVWFSWRKAPALLRAKSERSGFVCPRCSAPLMGATENRGVTWSKCEGERRCSCPGCGALLQAFEGDPALEPVRFTRLGEEDVLGFKAALRSRGEFMLLGYLALGLGGGGVAIAIRHAFPAIERFAVAIVVIPACFLGVWMVVDSRWVTRVVAWWRPEPCCPACGSSASAFQIPVHVEGSFFRTACGSCGAGLECAQSLFTGEVTEA